MDKADKAAFKTGSIFGDDTPKDKADVDLFV